MIDASYMKASSKLPGSEASQSGYHERRVMSTSDPLSASNTERNMTNNGQSHATVSTKKHTIAHNQQNLTTPDQMT